MTEYHCTKCDNDWQSKKEEYDECPFCGAKETVEVIK